MIDQNGKPIISFIDKGVKKVDVGSKLSDFKIERQLGSGHFGSVQLVRSLITNKLYAMKEIKGSTYKTEDQKKEVEREIKLLENLDHPHVIRYFNSFRENDNFYIITEYINGGSLDSLIKKNIMQKKLFDEKILWEFLIQSLSGLLYLHETKKIIHRDIKPDNLLLDYDGNLKISDFGISAINSESAEDLLKCHNTMTGPIQFMSPEMGLRLNYDFKSDIYMLGLTFFYMMSNTLPEKKLDLGPIIIPIKDQNAKMPETYSETLRNFVQKLLKNYEERPTTKRAYSEAITFYSFRYLKMTSVCSTLQCFWSIPDFCQYFKGERVKKYVEDNNQDKKYLLTKTFKEAFMNIDPNNFNFESARLECLKFRIVLYARKEHLLFSPEISLVNLIPDIINKLHNELHKPINKSQNQGDNDINTEEDNRPPGKIDETNEQAVIEATVKKYTEQYRSKISDLFFYLSKACHECPDCRKNIKYSCSIYCVCALYPYRTSLYLTKKDLNIIDLFKHYQKKRLFIDQNDNCPTCGKVQKSINRSKILYTCPPNFVLEVSCENEDKYNLTIDEYINLENFVERKDISKTKYKLVGAIFFETNDKEGKKYVSITRKENGGWIYFNGNTVEDCTFNDLANHKKLQNLFYTSA